MEICSNSSVNEFPHLKLISIGLQTFEMSAHLINKHANKVKLSLTLLLLLFFVLEISLISFEIFSTNFE